MTIKKLEADQKGDVKVNLLLRCGCPPLKVHKEAFEHARTEINLRSGQKVFKFPCPCSPTRPQEVIDARYYTQ